MRKGFIPTLTALVTALLVTSAMALGPTISNVPDVFIGNQAASGAPAEPGTNMFRYSDALVLWDYVTPGVTTGDGSTSDTVYWAWAAKKADLSGGTGGFLDPSLAATNVDGIVYSIIQENAVTVDPIQPVEAENSAAWTAEINNYLTGLGSGLADQSLGSAGSLTFRNIRLSRSRTFLPIRPRPPMLASRLDTTMSRKPLCTCPTRPRRLDSTGHSF